MSRSTVELISHGPVRQIQLNAPERLNALDRPMLNQLASAIATVAADDSAAALVVSGAGRAFCAGADVRNLFGDTTRRTSVIRDELKGVYAGFLGLRELRIPTIAAIHGAAVGAGVNIALACDLVIVGPKARFVVSFAEIGLHPGGGCSWFLTRRLGAQRAMALALGAESIDAAGAVDLGLALQMEDDPTAAALAHAYTFATRDPGLLRDMKRAIQLSEQSDLCAVLEFESWAQASSVGTSRFQQFLAEFGRR